MVINSYQRVVKAIEFGKIDRFPLLHWVSRAVLDKWGKKLKDILSQYPSDFAGQEVCNKNIINSPFKKGIQKDAWGCYWENKADNMQGLIKSHPLTEWKSLKFYKFPSPLTGDFGNEWDGVEKIVHQNKGKKYILVRAAGGRLFERMHFLRGFENLMMDIADEREELFILRDKIVNHTLEGLNELFNKYDVDGVLATDDWGTQKQIMIDPKSWQKIFKPSYQKIINFVHKRGKHFFLHSDGYIMGIIPDLIEIGVDVLNTQFSCTSIKDLSEICKGKICILSHIDKQYTLPMGNIKEVEEYVRKVVNYFPISQSGIIARAETGLDIPVENIETMLKIFFQEKKNKE